MAEPAVSQASCDRDITRDQPACRGLGTQLLPMALFHSLLPTHHQRQAAHARGAPKAAAGRTAWAWLIATGPMEGGYWPQDVVNPSPCAPKRSLLLSSHLQAASATETSQAPSSPRRRRRHVLALKPHSNRTCSPEPLRTQAQGLLC